MTEQSPNDVNFSLGIHSKQSADGMYIPLFQTYDGNPSISGQALLAAMNQVAGRPEDMTIELLYEHLPPPKQKLILAGGQLVIDRLSKSVMVHDNKIALSAVPFNILGYLAERADIAVPSSQLISVQWPYGYHDKNILNVNILAIRKALGVHMLGHSKSGLLQTIRGVGYMLLSDVPRADE